MAKKGMPKTHTGGMTKDNSMSVANAAAKRAGHGKGTTTADSAALAKGKKKLSLKKSGD